MPRLSAVLLPVLAACSTLEPPGAPPGARPVEVGFEEAPGGVRLVVNGVRVGSTEEEARLALGRPEAPHCAQAAHRAALAGPEGSRARISWTARAGRVTSLEVAFAGPPWTLMKAWVALARAARAAGETCGPEGCRDRDRLASARLLVERRLAWPLELAVRDAAAPGPEASSALALVR